MKFYKIQNIPKSKDIKNDNYIDLIIALIIGMILTLCLTIKFFNRNKNEKVDTNEDFENS